MKKRALVWVMALLLLLSGCGLGEQLTQLRHDYIDPAIEQAMTGIAPTERPNSGAGPNLKTDRSALTASVRDSAVFSRLSADRISELRTSANYGRLLPLNGGFVTADGTIVLDEGYQIYEALYTDSAGRDCYLDAYLLFDGESWAACGGDGSWMTDFGYECILPMELGLLCIYDGENNGADCFDESGKLLFDTGSFHNRLILKRGSAERFAEYSGGYMLIEYTNGQRGFMRTDGSILNRDADLPSFFDNAKPFSEGLAAVCNEGIWGYLQKDGTYAIERGFEAAGSFRGGLAAVRDEGVWCIIDREGEVKKRFEGVASLTVEDGYIEADGEYYTVTTLEPAVFYGYEGQPIPGGFWVRGENGVRVFLQNGNQVYFSGAVALKERIGELWSVELADGSSAVMDSNSRVITFEASKFTSDLITGDCYIYSRESAILSDASGRTVTGASGLIIDGCAQCTLDGWTGWKNLDNEWLIRIPCPTAD